MKVTIVTPVLNCARYISECVESVLCQDYLELEYIVIDGGSTDGTISVLEDYAGNISEIVIATDCGSYSALNKGINLATGDLVGLLNADDFLASPTVVSEVVALMKKEACDVVYGNLDMIKRNDHKKVVRKWRPGRYAFNRLEFGWMPPHPTLYVRRSLLRKHMPYNECYGSCADYDLMIRLFHDQQIKIGYLDKLMVKMRAGGQSNGSLAKMFRGFLGDYRVLKANRIRLPLFVAGIKKLRKVPQML